MDTSPGSLFHIIGLGSDLSRAQNSIQLAQQEVPSSSSQCMLNSRVRPSNNSSRRGSSSDFSQRTTYDLDLEDIEISEEIESEYKQNIVATAGSDRVASEDGPVEKANLQSRDKGKAPDFDSFDPTGDLAQAPGIATPSSNDTTLVDSDEESRSDGLNWSLATSMIASYLDPPCSMTERYENILDLDVEYDVFNPTVAADNELKRRDEELERKVERHRNSHDIDFEDNAFNPFVVAENEEKRREEERLDQIFYASYRDHEHRFQGPLVEPWPLLHPESKAQFKEREYLEIPCNDHNARGETLFRIQIADLISSYPPFPYIYPVLIMIIQANSTTPTAPGCKARTLRWLHLQSLP